MKRALLLGLASLLAAGIVAPVAQGAKIQTRYLEGKLDGGGRVQLTAQFTVRPGGESKKKWIISNGKWQFVPKFLTFSATYSVPVRCQEGNTTLSHKRGPLDPNTPGERYLFRQGNFHYVLGENDRQGKFGGGIWEKGKRARASGALKWIYETVPQPSGPDYTLCTTNGPRQFSAHECLRKGKLQRGLPRCRKAGWF